jgi:hypothetical protein
MSVEIGVRSPEIIAYKVTKEGLEPRLMDSFHLGRLRTWEVPPGVRPWTRFAAIM